MQNLQILTNNKFGADFWQQRAGMIDGIEFNPLDFTVFKNLIVAQNEFILVDFYYSKLTLQQENELIKKLEEYVLNDFGFLKLFILTPSFAGAKLEDKRHSNRTVIIHNYTCHFLRKLSSASKSFI